jgi:hypothetical protein
MGEKELLEVIQKAARDGTTGLNLSYQNLATLPAGFQLFLCKLPNFVQDSILAQSH